MSYLRLLASGDNESHTERDRLHSKDWSDRDKGLELYSVSRCCVNAPMHGHLIKFADCVIIFRICWVITHVE